MKNTRQTKTARTLTRISNLTRPIDELAQTLPAHIRREGVGLIGTLQLTVARNCR